MRNVIVTGGSRGLGLCVARKLSADGDRAIVIARNMNPSLANAVVEAEQNWTGRLSFVPFDFADIEQIPELVKKLRKCFGPVQGLVNNAAIGLPGALALMNNAEIEKMIRVNTLAPVILTKYVVRHMLADGGGSVVNVASIAASTGYRGLSVYSATKAFMIGLTHSLAREVGCRDINVNAVAPGFMDTDMTRELSGDDLERLVRRSALGRVADVEDVAGAIEFLLSPKAKNITGTVLTVDAGATA